MTGLSGWYKVVNHQEIQKRPFLEEEGDSRKTDHPSDQTLTGETKS